MSPTAERELRSDAVRNRARVLAVAREHMTRGDISLAMNVIARDAGVGVGTVYRHFPTRQVLLEQLAMDSLSHLLAVTQAAAADDDPGHGLAHLLRETLACLLDDVALTAVLRTPEVECLQTSQLRVDLVTALSTLLERARESGAIRRDVGADDLRRYLCGLEHAVRLSGHQSGQDGQRGQRDLEILLAGLRPATG